MNPKLHELHRRRLQVAARLVEEALNRSELLLREGGQQGIVRVVEDTLAEEQRSELVVEIKRLRVALREFVRCYALDPYRLDIRQLLVAEFSSIWFVLENCRPKRMKGYGVEFEEETKAQLEESVGQLLSHIEEMLQRVR